MAENSKIEWTTHTFNPWRGCTRVSEGCAHCYAETLAKRNPAVLGEWGPGRQRVLASEAMWKQPLKWNALAAGAAERPRVFCASLADWLDSDGVPIEWLLRLLRLIWATPNLDWLLLTKRPEAFFPRMTQACDTYCPQDKADREFGQWLVDWSDKDAPRNVWMGVTAENQKRADERIPLLLNIPARVRFLSCEPLLGPVVLPRDAICQTASHVNLQPEPIGAALGLPTRAFVIDPCLVVPSPISWVIAGGESGGGARPMHPDWARGLRDQCQAAGVPFFFKQWGNWRPVCAQYPQTPAEDEETEDAGCCGDIALESTGQIAEGYQPITPRCWIMDRMDKKLAGRELDGRTWDEYPT